MAIHGQTARVLQDVPHPLQQAFRQFAEASEKLERKYDLLAKETQILRAQLAAKEDEIKRAERLATLGETAAGLAHEIRNPLGAIKLFVSLLKQDLLSQPGPLELVQQVEKGIASLDNVVSNILHFSKDAKPVLAPVNLHALVREQVCQVTAVAPPDVVFDVDLQGAPFLQGNEAGLRQAVSNLLLNAVQAVGSTGRIAVVCWGDADNLRLQIRDSGPGIDPQVIDRIFDPFVSTKNEGTGLGLTIVKRIMDQHGAVIAVRNCGGAEFSMVFKRTRR